MAAVLRERHGQLFCGWQILRKKDKTPKTSQVNALAEDENDGSLRNGGVSDPAETTVGKLAIS